VVNRKGSWLYFWSANEKKSQGRVETLAGTTPLDEGRGSLMLDNASAFLTTSQIALQSFAFKRHSRGLSPFEQLQRDLARIEQLEEWMRWIEDYENGHGVVQ
jgi:hypothetical protein